MVTERELEKGEIAFTVGEVIAEKVD